jgi:mRNA-degrading endonuclease RelE of RelBE toxin-antitoxin system
MTRMTEPGPYRIVYAPAVRRHVGSIDRRYHALVRRTIEEQLRHEPCTETLNRKPLRRPGVLSATWEIRFGPENRFRVFYDVAVEAGQVAVLAVGVKDRNRLLIAGEEIPT